MMAKTFPKSKIVLSPARPVEPATVYMFPPVAVPPAPPDIVQKFDPAAAAV
jgi:hypothetical protein